MKASFDKNAESRSGTINIVESCEKIWSVLRTILDSLRRLLQMYCHIARTGLLRKIMVATTTHKIARPMLVYEPPREVHGVHCPLCM